MSREGRKIIKRWMMQAEAAGWTVEYGGGHIKFWPPGSSTPVAVPSTPGMGRSMQNTRANLRRAGLPVEL